ncbi:hypothetical protein F7725_014815 [Dissostichus mawsoni]|uniref:Muscarinic acetylcholine receptor n=1 Tax=Dissostichus mawsoni TaxID=36200 RepID=A0A7J5Z017_DISMA|nr:hypothetical protein F7725_026356 [Dissostichus mawsoni]KAF3854127.1 hypothetical protein F7725_014815 [Dissostichus mawsoni]
MTSSSDSPHFLTIMNEPAILGGSYQGLDILSDSVGGWKQHNVSHLSGPEGNYTDSPGNPTLMLPAEEFDPLGGHTVLQVLVIVFLTGSLSIVTVVGNILVMVSFKINKALKTVNNYYLLSLAFADLTIGTLSMNLYTTYIIMNQWALGPVVCDLWLAIDYVASNASVMNLLVISFDRYFSVTRPLTYRAKRTTKRAMTMIGLAWSISFILWAPAILFWQYIVGERTVTPNHCYIQFLSEPIITFCTAIAAFYLPKNVIKICKVSGGLELAKAQARLRIKEVAVGKLVEKVTNSQKDSSAMQRQMSSQSCSSNELNQSASEKNNKENTSMAENRKQREFSSLLPGRHAFKRSVNTTITTVGEAEQSSSESLNIEAVALGTSPGKNNKDKQSSSNKGRKESQTNPASQSPAAITMKDAAMAKRFASKAKTEINKRKNEKKANEKRQMK